MVLYFAQLALLKPQYAPHKNPFIYEWFAKKYLWGSIHDRSHHYGNSIVIQELTPKGYPVPNSGRKDGNYNAAVRK